MYWIFSLLIMVLLTLLILFFSHPVGYLWVGDFYKMPAVALIMSAKSYSVLALDHLFFEPFLAGRASAREAIDGISTIVGLLIAN